MKLFFYVLSLLIIAFSQPAQASSWLECEIKAEVTQVGTNSYTVKIISGTVTDGYDKQGDQCLQKGKTHKIKDENHALRSNSIINLKYNTYSGMGENGVVESTAWEVVSTESAQKEQTFWAKWFETILGK